MTVQPSKGLSTALFLTVLGIYILLSPAHFLTSPDEELNLRTTLSFLQGHGGAIPSLEGFASKTGQNGLEYAQYGLGLPLASLPWCALGTMLDPSPNKDIANTLSSHFNNTTSIDSTGTDFLRCWMSIFNMIVTALTVVLIHSIVHRIGLSPINALFISLFLAFGSYAWPHGRTFFTEPLAAFCFTAAVYCILKTTETEKPAIWTFFAGLFWAYAVLTRLDSLITVPAAAWLLTVKPKRPKIEFSIDLRKIIAFALPWFAALGLILFYNYHRFGSLGSTGYEDQPEKIRFITPLLVGLQGFFFTPGRSIFLYSPPLILALFGAIRLWKRDAWLAGGVFLIVAGYLGAMSKWQNWAGGYDWGPRHVYQITPFLAIAAAAWMGDRNLFERSAQRIGWAILAVVSLFIQFLGLSADSIFTIKWFLTKTLQSFPENAVPLAHKYIIQLPIYLPQFSSPVLHWQWITGHGADLMLVHALSGSPALLFIELIALAMACGGGGALWLCMRRSTKNVIS